jgi:O-Antigen ligase
MFYKIRPILINQFKERLEKNIYSGLGAVAAIAVFFQGYISLRNGVISLNLADPFAFLAILVVSMNFLYSRKLPGWIVPKFNFALGALSLLLLTGFIRAWLDIGITQWALSSRLMGWVMLLGYLSVGYLVVAGAGYHGLRRFASLLIATASVVIVLQMSFRLLAHWGINSGIPISYNFDGFAANRNAFAFQLLTTIILFLGFSMVYARRLEINQRAWLVCLPRLLLGILLVGLFWTGSRAGIGIGAMLLIGAWIGRLADRKTLVWAVLYAIAIWIGVWLMTQTVPAQTIPAQTIPAKTVPAQTIPAQTIPAQTIPAQTVPAKTIPAQTVPAQTIPAQTIPAKTIPAQTIPAQTIPAQTIPAQTIPAKTIPAQTIPAQTIPAKTIPAKTIPAQTIPAQTIPAQTIPAQTIPAKTIPAQTIPAQTIPAQTVNIQSQLSGIASNEERLATYTHALELWRQSPLFGAGLGVFIAKSPVWFNHQQVIHNTALWILAEFGLVGVFVFGWVFFILCRYALASRKSIVPAQRALLMLLVVFAVFSLVHEIFYQRIFWLVLGALLAKPFTSKVIV